MRVGVGVIAVCSALFVGFACSSGSTAPLPVATSPHAAPPLVGDASIDADAASPNDTFGNDAGTCRTRLRGKVYDPSGKTPLYNVHVYIPSSAPPPFTDGASCKRCERPANARAIAVTDSTGAFSFEDITGVVTLILEVGKWRREVTVDAKPCVDTIVDPEFSRLPRNQFEGHIPKIALTTGGADALECLLRKIGLDDSEFTAAGGSGRVHMFRANGGSAAIENVGPLTDATSMWNDAATMMPYDMLLMSCEGAVYEAQKNPAALYAYASAGGRVFASHYHEVWFRRGPDDVKNIGTWVDEANAPQPPNPSYGTLDTTFPKGLALKRWLENQNALTGNGQLLIYDPRFNLYDDVDPAKATTWIRVPNPRANAIAPQYVSFNTPVLAPEDQLCGRVVYSDLHVAAGNAPGRPFPNGCQNAPLTPQERTLEFMLFDLAACVIKDDVDPADIDLR